MAISESTDERPSRPRKRHDIETSESPSKGTPGARAPPAHIIAWIATTTDRDEPQLSPVVAENL